MSDMVTFRISIAVEHPAHRGNRVGIADVLVDTGSEFTWLPTAVLQQLGIAEAVKPKSVLWKGGYAAEALLNGQAELCVHQISEIMPVKGVTLVGPLPPEVNKVTTYSGGLVASSATPDAARALLAYLARPEFRPKFAAAGLDYK